MNHSYNKIHFLSALIKENHFTLTRLTLGKHHPVLRKLVLTYMYNHYMQIDFRKEQLMPLSPIHYFKS